MKEKERKSIKEQKQGMVKKFLFAIIILFMTVSIIFLGVKFFANNLNDITESNYSSIEIDQGPENVTEE